MSTRSGRTAAIALTFGLVACVLAQNPPATGPVPAAARAPASATAPASEPAPVQPAPLPEKAPQDKPPAPPTATATAPESVLTKAPAATASAPTTVPAEPKTAATKLAPPPTSAPVPADPYPDLALRDGDTIVFLGDELTDTPRPTATNSFPMLAESFLTVRYPERPLHYVNAGWAGDTAERALLRVQRDVLVHKPTVVVICLGLNDPEYLPFDEKRLVPFRADLTKLVEQCRSAGARVWLMSPCSVDEEAGQRARVQRGGQPGITDLKAIQYNEVLARYAQTAAEVAKAPGCGFVDWFTASMAARAQARADGSEFASIDSGLHPLDRGHALAAALLIQAWGGKPIEVQIAANFSTGEVSVQTHLSEPVPVRGFVAEGGQRIIELKQLPMPWPMATGQTEFLAPQWKAAAMCRFMLQVAGTPAAGVRLELRWPSGAAAIHEPLTAEALQAGVNLAAIDTLQSVKDIAELFQLIGTKIYYNYGIWRKLALSPPKEPELIEAHRKLVDAWQSYVNGTEQLIRKHPKRFDLTLVLTETAPTEQLPTQPVQPPVIAAAPSPGVEPGTQPTPANEPTSAPANIAPVSTAPADATVATRPAPAPPATQPAPAPPTTAPAVPSAPASAPSPPPATAPAPASAPATGPA